MYKGQAMVLLFGDKGLHSIHDSWLQHQGECKQSLLTYTGQAGLEIKTHDIKYFKTFKIRG